MVTLEALYGNSMCRIGKDLSQRFTVTLVLTCSKYDTIKPSFARVDPGGPLSQLVAHHHHL